MTGARTKSIARPLPTTITVAVPISFARRGGRKTIIGPVPHMTPAPKYDNALIKALARGHRWRRIIETGKYSSVTELAKGEKLNESYACRMLRLSLLAPEIVEAILNGRQPNNLRLSQLLRPMPASWDDQVRCLLPGHN